MRVPNWMWPEIHDEASAITAVNQGAAWAIVVAIVDAAVGSVYLLTVRPPVTSLVVWVYAEAALVGLLAFAISKRSRVAAVIGLAFWLVSIGFKLIQGRSLYLAFLVLLGFIGGVRGTFAYGKYRTASAGRTLNELDARAGSTSP